MFAYCRNNPVRRVDISGSMDQDCYDNDPYSEEDLLKTSEGGGGTAFAKSSEPGINTYKSGNKTVDDLLNNLPDTTNGKGFARNFESTGGFPQTLRDFFSLNPSDIKDIQTQYGPGKEGKLSKGTSVVARPGSTTGGATLEIRVSSRRIYKIRY